MQNDEHKPDLLLKKVFDPKGPGRKGIDPHQLKLGIYGFLLVLLISMLSLKPYLPRAIFHNFAKIDDYRIFSNRLVLAGNNKQPWKRGAAEIAGPDARTAQQLIDLKTTALLVLENGNIVYEKYGETGGVETLSGSFSMAKSIVALLTGFALQDHRIRSLDESISTYITEWEGREEGKISIKNLLSMTSGLNWNETYSNPFSITTEAYYGTDLHFTALRQRAVVDPGTRFEYQSGSTELLGLVLSRAVNLSLASYASQKLWMPLGAEKDALWSLDHEEGLEKAFCCFNATARDFSRIGEFVRLRGNWNGKQLLNAAFIDQMLTPNGILDTSGKPTNYYGFQWWILHTPKGDVPYARGILGQYIVVLPQKNRVLVRLGMKAGKIVDGHPEELVSLVNWMLQD